MTNWLRNNELIINTERGKIVTLFGTNKRLCKLNNPPLINIFEILNSCLQNQARVFHEKWERCLKTRKTTQFPHFTPPPATNENPVYLTNLEKGLTPVIILCCILICILYFQFYFQHIGKYNIVLAIAFDFFIILRNISLLLDSFSPSHICLLQIAFSPKLWIFFSPWA